MLEEKGRLKIQMEENIKKDEIDYKEAKQIISEYPNTILLDVRSKQEYDEGHLPSSICICLYVYMCVHEYVYVHVCAHACIYVNNE